MKPLMTIYQWDSGAYVSLDIVGRHIRNLRKLFFSFIYLFFVNNRFFRKDYMHTNLRNNAVARGLILLTEVRWIFQVHGKRYFEPK